MATESARRKFKIRDDKFIEAARTKHGFFLQDQSDFETFDKDFDDPFATGWLTEIDNAENEPTNEMVEDESTQLTDAVEAQMVLCRGKFQDAKYFIEKTFPGKTKVWNEFGYDDYERARKSQTLMIQFMITFHAVSVKYGTELNAKGYTTATIASIDTLATALQNANTAQEIFIGNMPVQTQSRIEKYNTAWTTMVNVCSAGKVIYKNNYAKYQRYLLPAGEESADEIKMSGLVTAAATGNPLAGVLVSITDLGIETLTGDDGLYAFGGIPDGTYVLSFSLAGYQNQEQSATITDGVGVVINVQMDAA